MLGALYRFGLLGVVQHDLARGGWRRHFLRPGESAADPSPGLPRAAHCLVHPVLSDTVAALNPGFVLRSDGLNIIGHDRPWQTPD